MNRPRRLDRRGFLALLRAAKDRRRLTAQRDFFLLYLGGRTGLRPTELRQLRVKDFELLLDPPFLWVDTLKQRPRVRRGWGRSAGRVRVEAPPRDQVLLEARVVKRARRYLRRVLPALLGRESFGVDHVFPAQRRKRPARPATGNASVTTATAPMSLRNMDRLFVFYRERARLNPKVTLHSLRHYRAMTLWTTSRHDLEFVRQQLRHRTLRATQEYLGVDPADERRYLDRLDRRS